MSIRLQRKDKIIISKVRENICYHDICKSPRITN